MKYTAANVKGDIDNKKDSISFDILEDGIAIASVTRGRASRYGWIPRMVFKFHTEASELRFQDFCDSLSMSETAEILVRNAGVAGG